VKIQVNGESREVANDLSLEQLVIDLQLTPQRIAVELNREVVRRADWPSTMLRESDRVEIVHFVGGGVYGVMRPAW
jgi:thiamine biosynthesis protein ThiS